MANPQIENLANLMRELKKSGEKLVVMLGAGASIGSGVKGTPTIMKELLEKYGRGLEGGSVEERFDRLWRDATLREREIYMRPYLNVQPSSGYASFVSLVKHGYVDVIVTLNFDDLVEKAFSAAGLKERVDFIVIRRGETEEASMETLLREAEPRIKVFKLHGSIRGTHDLLFSSKEMVAYPPVVAGLVGEITRRAILVVGCGFEDSCLTGAFAKQGEMVICVNPGGAPRNLRGLQEVRGSEKWDIRATFDAFFEELWQALSGEVGQERTVAPEAAPPARNPFKFLESYEAEDRELFMERGLQTRQFMKAIGSQPSPHVIILAGRAGVGKTSLVKASLIPELTDAGHTTVYVRCRDRDVSAALHARAIELGLIPRETAPPQTLDKLRERSERQPLTVFLDQFERVTNVKNAQGGFAWEREEEREPLMDSLQVDLLQYASEKLRLVLVVRDPGSLGGHLMQACYGKRPAYLVECDALEKRHVVNIINGLAQKAGIPFRPDMVEELASRYEQSGRGGTPFTLAHVQAVCHLLAQAIDDVDYKPLDEDFAALDQAINVSDIINFVEDFVAYPDSDWLRNIIKVPLREKKEQIAGFVRQHYKELVPPRHRARGAEPGNAPQAGERPAAAEAR